MKMLPSALMYVEFGGGDTSHLSAGDVPLLGNSLYEEFLSVGFSVISLTCHRLLGDGNWPNPENAW